METLINPVESLERKGLPTEGEINIPLTLTLTTSPHLDELLRWYEQHSYSRHQQSTQTESKVAGLGLLGTIGVIAAGWFVADSIFGKDEKDN